MSDYEWKIRVKYSPDQPRVPAGSSEGGRWTSGGGGGGGGMADVDWETGLSRYEQVGYSGDYEARIYEEESGEFSASTYDPGGKENDLGKYPSKTAAQEAVAKDIHQRQNQKAPDKATGIPEKTRTAIRTQLGEEFTTRALDPRQIKFIRYRQRKNDILLEDAGGRLGNIRTNLTRATARARGFTLEQAIEYLEANGASKIKPQRRQPSYSRYD